MRKFMMILNNVCIGIMTESFAHSIAPVVCAKLGDVLTLEQEWEDSYSYYVSGETQVTHTYYHNGSDLLCFSHTNHYEPTLDSEEEIQGKLRTKTYTDRLTKYKYEMRGARNMQHSSNYITHMKRDMRRTERRVGKALTDEQMDS